MPRKQYPSDAYDPEKYKLKRECPDIVAAQREASKKWALKNPDKIRDIKLKHSFGITLEQYQSMLESQSGCCAICSTDQSELDRRLAVDHCHTTGKIRGLLCASCNKGLGFFRDSTELVERAKAYLEASSI